MYNATLRHAPATEPSRRVFCVQDARLLFAANVMLAMDEIRKFGGMSVQDLKLALKAIPGAAGLRLNYAPNGNELVTIAGRTVEVGPMATNAEIIAAFAAPLPTNGTITVVGEAAPLPVPRLAPITTIAPVAILSPTGTPKMSITGAVNAGMTIKDLIAGSRTAVQAAHNKLIQNAGKVSDAAAALDGLGTDLGNEADDLMSMIGQFKNDLTPSTPAATPLPPAPAITPA